MKNDEKDVGLVEDAIFYLKNCLAAENHALMSFINTKDKKWLQAMEFIRERRSKLLNSLVKKEQSQIYCFSKHILAMSMASYEVGNRYLESGNSEIAKELFEDAGSYESLFLLFNGIKGVK